MRIETAGLVVAVIAALAPAAGAQTFLDARDLGALGDIAAGQKELAQRAAQRGAAVAAAVELPARALVEAARSLAPQTAPHYGAEGRLECSRLPPADPAIRCALTIDGKTAALASSEAIGARLFEAVPPRGPVHVVGGTLSVTSSSSEMPPFDVTESAVFTPDGARVRAVSDSGVWPVKHAIALTRIAVAVRAPRVLEKAAAKFGGRSKTYRDAAAELSRISDGLEALDRDTQALTPERADADPAFRRRLDALGDAYSDLLKRVGWTDADEREEEPEGD